MRSTSVFLSYSSRDRKDAFAVKQLLEENQVKVWLDFFDIRMTAELSSQLAEKVRDAEVFCLLLSPTAVQSPWVSKEIESALAVARNGLRILPVILRPCQIPAELSDIVGFDASDGLENEAVRLRPVRAICGNESVEDRVLLDSANRLLLANKEILLTAEAEVPVEKWKAALAAEVGEAKVPLLAHVAASDQLPVWLQPSDPNGWPTKPQASSALGYVLKIPARWNAEPEVRGTAREVEHIYRGRESTEWLIVSFMDKANAESNMKLWIETYISMSRFPVITGNKTPPELREWNYLGRMPALAKKLHADEAHAYTGTALYTVDQHPLLGRLYIAMVRRKTFAWKFALSIETGCLEGTPEARIASQDHVRAGAIFGSLLLDEG
jgi:hypothetical protein